jgi:acetolactate synthase-1/2/3 large subunit
MNLTGAELIIRFLESRSCAKRDADTVAVIAGGDALRPLQRALADSTLQCVRKAEADVLFFDYGSGLSKAADVLASAKVHRRPLVCIAVQVRRSLIGSEVCRPADTRRVIDPLTKTWFHVGAAMELLQLLPEACRVAASGRRGPVLLEIPADVLTETVAGAWIPQTRARASTVRTTANSMLPA